MSLIQGLFILILNPICRAITRVKETTRNSFIFFSCTGIVIFFVLFFSTSMKPILKKELTMDSRICTIMILVIILFSLKKEVERVKWNPPFFYLFFVSGAGILITGFLHPIGRGYMDWGFLMMTVFPCLYFVWNNRCDYDVLYKRLSAGTILVGTIYYAYCFYLSNKGRLVIVGDRMRGTFYDANMFSMIGMIMVSCSVYMLLVNRSSKAWFLLTAIGFGIGNSITLLGQSRLSILSNIGSIAALIIFYMKTKEDYEKNEKKIKRFVRAELLLLSLVLFVMIGNLMVSLNNRAMEDNNSATVASTVTIPVTADKAINTSDTILLSGGPLDRFIPKGNSLNSYTAGRYNIWKNYARHLNMLGNDFSKADWMELTGKTVKHAHNNFLEIGYRCGVPVAIAHTLLELLAGIVCIVYLFSRRFRSPYHLFCIVFMITYTIQSLFDIATIPFERPAPFFFYMALIPLFGRTKQIHTKR